MSISFKNKSDRLLSTFAKLLVAFELPQYLFAAQCIWWIAMLVQLDPALQYFLDHREFPSEVWCHNEEPEIIEASLEREIPVGPGDIQQWSVIAESPVPANTHHQADPLGRTRKGKLNPSPTTRKQLKVEWKRLANLQKKQPL